MFAARLERDPEASLERKKVKKTRR